MLHLLNLEWKKQQHYILFKVLMAAYLLFLPGLLMIGKKMDFGEKGPFDPQVMLFHFPTVWDWLGYVGNWLVFFVFGFMAVLLITNEHSSRTLRQNIITGLHRREFFISKMTFILVISLVATLYYSLCALVIGTLHAETLYFSAVFKHWDLIPRYFLMAAGYMSFGLLIGVFIKRTGIALFVFLAYSMFLEPVLRWALHLRFFKNSSMNYYPLNAIEDLCPLPFSEISRQFTKENNFELVLSSSQAAIASAVWIGIFFYLSYWRLKKSDL